MALHINCPNGHLLEIEDAFLGRKVRCPHCQAIMRPQAPPGTAVIAAIASPPPAAPAAGSPAEAVEVLEIVEGPPTARRVIEEDLPPPRRRREVAYDDVDDGYDDEPRREKPSKMKKATRMRLASVGLAFHAGKILCYLIGILCCILAMGVAMVGATSGSASVGLAITALIFMGIFLLLWLLAPLLGTIGSMLCMWVPHKTGGKILIIISFVLDALGLMIYLGCQLISLLSGAFAFNTATMSGAGGAADALGGLALAGVLTSMLMLFAAWILFMLFLRNMLLYFRESGFAHDCLQTLMFCIGLGVFTPLYFGGGVLLVGLVARAIKVPGVAMAVAGLALLMLVILWIVCWVNLLIKILNQIVVVRGHLSAWT